MSTERAVIVEIQDRNDFAKLNWAYDGKLIDNPEKLRYHIINTIGNLGLGLVFKEKRKGVETIPKIQQDITGINELVSFFSSITIDEKPIRLDSSSLIINPRKFVSGHIDFCLSNLGKPSFKAYLDRLIRLKKILEK